MPLLFMTVSFYLPAKRITPDGAIVLTEAMYALGLITLEGCRIISKAKV